MSQAAIVWLALAAPADASVITRQDGPEAVEPSSPATPELTLAAPEIPPTEPSSPTAGTEPLEPGALPPDGPSTTDPCPCDGTDAQCMDAHAEACPRDPVDAPEPSPPAVDPSPPERSAPPAPEVPEYPPYRFDDWQRRGVLIRLGVGVAGCGRSMCEGFKAGGHGGFEMGYRFGVVAPIVAASAGGGRGGVSDDLRAGGWDPAKSAVTLIDAGVGVLLFPVRSGRFDPYVGVRIGGTWFAQRIDYTGDDPSSQGANARLSVRRGAVRLSGGFDIFVRPVFSLGPRFDVALPFGGRVCITGDVVGFPDDRSCMAVKAASDAEMVGIPLDTRDLPLPWSFSLVARLVLPPLPTTSR